MKNSSIGQSDAVSLMPPPRFAVVAEPVEQACRGAEVFAVDWQLPDQCSWAS